MAVKEFAHDARGYVLMGDERDIAISSLKRQDVYEWAGQNGITIEYQGSLGGVDLGGRRNIKQRVWFNLKWL